MDWIFWINIFVTTITALLLLYFLDSINTIAKLLLEIAKNSKEISDILKSKKLPPKYYTLEK